MHTTVGFYQQPDHETLANVAAVTDQHVRVSGDDIYVPLDFNVVVAAVAMGWNIRHAKLVSPSLRRLFNPWIEPKVSLSPDALDIQTVMDLKDTPLPLASNEALNAQMMVSENNTATGLIVGVNLAAGPLARVGGEIFPLKIIKIVESKIGVWTNHSLDLSIDLPVGRYQVVGAQCYGDQPGLFRLVPIGEKYRPGGMMFTDYKYADVSKQRFGNWGVWCEFDQLTPPSLDILPSETLTFYTLVMDLVRVG